MKDFTFIASIIICRFPLFVEFLESLPTISRTVTKQIQLYRSLNTPRHSTSSKPFSSTVLCGVFQNFHQFFQSSKNIIQLQGRDPFWLSGMLVTLMKQCASLFWINMFEQICLSSNVISLCSILSILQLVFQYVCRKVCSCTYICIQYTYCYFLSWVKFQPSTLLAQEQLLLPQQEENGCLCA